MITANDNLFATESVCEEFIDLPSEILKCKIAGVFIFEAFNRDGGHARAMSHPLKCVIHLVI
jgi:hypothetical protein